VINVKVKNRLYLTTVIILFLVSIFSVTVILSTNQMDKEQEKHDLAMEVNHAIFELNIITYDYLLHHEKRMQEQWWLRYNSLGEIIEKEEILEDKFIKSINTEYINLAYLFQEITKNYEKEQELIREGASQKEINAIFSLEERLVSQLSIKSQMMSAAAAKLAHDSEVNRHNSQKFIETLLLILMTIFALITAIITFITNRSITTPLLKLVKGTKIIGAGNLDHVVEIKSHDEFEELTNSFNEMTKKRKHAESGLRTAAEEWKHTFDSMSDGISIHDLDMNLVNANEALAKMLGVPSEELIGKKCYQMVHNKDEAIDDCPMKKSILSTKPEHLEIFEPSFDCWLSISCSPLFNELGEITGIVHNVRDITDRKATEEKLLKQTYDVAERVKELAGLYGVSQLIADPDKTMDQVFRETVDLMPFSWQYPDITCVRISSSDKDFKTANWKKSRWTLSADIMGEKRGLGTVEVGYLEEKPEQDEGPFFKEERNLINGVARILGDYVKRKHVEKKIEKYSKNLEARVKERTAELESFSYSVSHDLRAPLRAIAGFSNILTDEYADHLDAKGKRYLSIIEDQSTYMGNLIDDILHFARISRQDIKSSNINMEKLAKSTYNDLKISYPDRKIKFTVKKLLPAQGDKTMIKQVFSNLIGNSIKFTTSQKNAVIEVGVTSDKDQNVYYVKDSGVGFDMKYVDNVWGVFQRLHSADEFEGTGVGLAIVKQIITRHEGNVWAEGKVNEGATFYFTLQKKPGRLKKDGRNFD